MDNIVYGAGDPGTLTGPEFLGQRIAYTGVPGANGVVYSPAIVAGLVPATSKGLHWMRLVQLMNYQPDGENVCDFLQAKKFSSGPTWASVRESWDMTQGNQGALYGDEIDIGANGVDVYNRFGAVYVFFKAIAAGARALMSYGVHFVPKNGDRNQAQLRNAVKVDIDCIEGVIGVGNGSESPTVLNLKGTSELPSLFQINSNSKMFRAGTPAGWTAHGFVVEVDGIKFMVPLITMPQ